MAKRNALPPSPLGPLVLDSSCWLEVFDGGARAALFEAVAAEPEKLIVPVITLYEVFKYLARVKGAESATRAALYMQRGRVKTWIHRLSWLLPATACPWPTV